jgi:pimeloyl-ACP methyl ester carboxylesterase
MKNKGSCLRILGWTGLVILLIIAGAALYLFWPVNPRAFAASSDPAADYEEAVSRVEALNAQEDAQGAALHSLCKTKLLTHGQKTERVVVLVHGFTTCPNQYQSLAPRLFDLGYNVLVAPLPHHGLADRMNNDQSNLKAEEIPAYANKVVDIARGLGDKVTMVGFSLGGATTAWTAQNRSDLDRALLIAPAFGFKAIPAALSAPFMRVLQLQPNSFAWWNEQEKEACGPEYAYPRYSSWALAQILRFGQAELADIKQKPPQAKSIVVMTNANDEAVNNEMIAQAVADWKKTSPEKISTYEFPAEMKLGHDIIDPSDKDGDIDAVYPKIIEFIQAP